MKIKDREQNNPKATLGLVDLEVAKSAVLSSLRSPGSRRCYEHAIGEFITWYCSEPRLGFNKVVVTRYRMHLESRGLAASGPVISRFSLRVRQEPGWVPRVQRLKLEKCDQAPHWDVTVSHHPSRTIWKKNALSVEVPSRVLSIRRTNVRKVNS